MDHSTMPRSRRSPRPPWATRPQTPTSTSASTGTPSGPPAGGPPPPPDFATAFGPIADRLAETKPDAVEADVDVMVALIRQAISSGSQEALESEVMTEPDAAIDKYMLSNCGYGELKGSAIDFEYDGLPSTLKSGPNAITLRNDGKEMHEIVLFRINDDVTLPWEEIIELPEEQAMSKGVPMGVVFVPPGKTGLVLLRAHAGPLRRRLLHPEGHEGRQGGRRAAALHRGHGRRPHRQLTR